jgi:CHAD domain-containing protein
VKELFVNAGYRLLAAKYVRKQAKQLRNQFDGICAAEDIEFVHRARVASRRLRAAMRIFGKCFRRRQAERWKKAIHRIRSELGDARDKDVQIELLRGILDSLVDKTCFAGVSRLLVQWECERERLQGNVVRAVKRLQRKGTLKDLENAAKAMLLKAEADDVQPASPESFAQARDEILCRLKRLLALQDCLGRSDDQQGHHAMRIAAKRLRYFMEIVLPIYSGALDGALEAIKQVQSLLGDVHDCDVWQEELRRFGDRERRRIESCYGHAAQFERLNPGIEYMRQDRLRRHHERFHDLVRLWGDLEARGVWRKLAGIVKCAAQHAGLQATAGETAESDNLPAPPKETQAS